jgi:hypothetical protein
LIIQKPKQYFGQDAYETYETDGTNTFEEWANTTQGVGMVAGLATLAGTILMLSGVGIPAGLLLLGTGITAAAGITTGGLRIYNRAEHSTLAWDASMAQNVVDIVAGLAAGSSMILRIAGMSVSTFGKGVLITNLAVDVSSGILLVDSVNQQIEDIKAKHLSKEEQEQQINDVIKHAAFSGMLIVVGFIGSMHELFSRPKINVSDMTPEQKENYRQKIVDMEKESAALKSKLQQIRNTPVPGTGGKMYMLTPETLVATMVYKYAYRLMQVAGPGVKYTWLRFKVNMEKRFPEIDMRNKENETWVKQQWERANMDINMTGISAERKVIINQYRQDYPGTKFTNYEMNDMLERGYTINPNTKRFNAPSDTTPTVRVVDAGEVETIAHDTLDPETKAQMDMLTAEREDFRQQKDKLKEEGKADTDEYTYAEYQMKVRSEKLGEVAAEGYIRKTYPGAVKIFPGDESISRKGEFDQVWELPGGKIMVVEAKGGSSTLGSRMVTNKIRGTKEGVRVEQGTKPYMLDIAEEMIKKGGESKKTGQKIIAAFEDKNLEYIAVRQAFTDKGVLKPIVKQTFDIYGKN